MKKFVLVTGPDRTTVGVVARTIATVLGASAPSSNQDEQMLDSPQGKILSVPLPTRHGPSHRYCPDLIKVLRTHQERDFDVLSIIVLREKTISLLAKTADECRGDESLAECEIQLARQTIVRLMRSPFRNYCFSYEAFLYLGSPYLEQLYRFVGVASNFTPDIQDPNQRYLEPFKRSVLPFVGASETDNSYSSTFDQNDAHDDEPPVAWDVDSPAVRKLARTVPCMYRGSESAAQQCLTASGFQSVKSFQCAIHGQCSTEHCVGYPTCVGCQDFTIAAACQPIRTFRIDGLGSGRDVLNGSIIRFGEQTLLAYRNGWDRGKVWLAELDEQFQPLWKRRLQIPAHQNNLRGQEDPRLFIYNDKLHVAYTGTETEQEQLAAHQLYCRLDENLEVEANFYPNYKHRAAWEKNWQFFDYGGQLLAVYAVQPHQILKIDADRATGNHSTSWTCLWKGGPLRGGASPVRVGDEYYSFAHDVDDRTRPRSYNMALYTFEAKPPFRVRRVVQTPLIVPGTERRPRFDTPCCIYPCGALLRSDRWIVSYGYFDREVRIAEFDREQIEQSLVEVPDAE